MQYAALRIAATTSEMVEGAYRDLGLLKKRDPEFLDSVSRTRETIETKGLLARMDDVLRALLLAEYPLKCD